MHQKPLTPPSINKRNGKPRQPDDEENPRPTIARPAVRGELFGGWGPKL